MNPAVRKVAESELGGDERIRIIEPLDVLDFHNFLARSYMILTDSGGCLLYTSKLYKVCDGYRSNIGIKLKLYGSEILYFHFYHYGFAHISRSFIIFLFVGACSTSDTYKRNAENCGQKFFHREDVDKRQYQQYVTQYYYSTGQYPSTTADRLFYGERDITSAVARAAEDSIPKIYLSLIHICIGITDAAMSTARAASREDSGMHRIALPPNSTSANCTADASAIIRTNAGFFDIPERRFILSVRTQKLVNIPMNMIITKNTVR